MFVYYFIKEFSPKAWYSHQRNPGTGPERERGKINKIRLLSMPFLTAVPKLILHGIPQKLNRNSYKQHYQ